MNTYNKSYIDAKLKRAKEKFGITGKKDSMHNRLPPGQYLTQQFPILDLGVRPALDLKNFKFELSGQIENPKIITYEDFIKLPSQTITEDFHCVTRWSKYDLTWKGVSFEEIVKLASPNPEVKYVIFKSRDGYSTNVPLEDCLRENVILAYELEGEEIPLLHGGPVRMVIPHLYGWKSAKFLDRIIFSSKDIPGFWETRGYHNYGDPWREERYS